MRPSEGELVIELLELLAPVGWEDGNPLPAPSNGKCCTDGLVCCCNIRTCKCTCDGCMCN